jgi:hypothetical protein
MRFLRAHTVIYSQMASGRLLISNPDMHVLWNYRYVLWNNMYRAAQTENAKSVSYQGLSQRGINE